MKLSLNIRPYIVATADDQIVKLARSVTLHHAIEHVLDVPHGLVVNVALGMSSVVASPAVAAAATWQLIGDINYIADFVRPKIKNARVLAIGQHDAGARQRINHRHQRLQVEPPIHDQVSAGQPRRKVEFLPQSLRLTGKNCLRARVVAVEPLRQYEDAGEVTAARMFAVAPGLVLRL